MSGLAAGEGSDGVDSQERARNPNKVWSYDLIAAFYATDMGLSMPFDDIAFYAALAQTCAGRTLELGCGSGRILIDIAARGVDVVGVDRSLPMLQQLRVDAARRALKPDLAQMDLRALALRGEFALILAPYSLLTYLTESADLDQFMAQARALMAPGGTLVLDSFIPRDVSPFDDFRQDYSRDYLGGQLQRAKRIAVLANGCNRIERRYRHLAADGTLIQEVLTQETIRPQSPAQLRDLLARHGMRVQAEYYDYAGATAAQDSRFYTVLACPQ